MIGKYIKKYRIKKGITQEELGRLVGVTTQAVSKWERGGVPDASLIPSIADTLDVTTDMLFGRSGTDKTENMIIKELRLLDSKARFKKAFLLLYAIGAGLSDFGIDNIKAEDLEDIKTKNGKSYYSRMCVDEGIIDARMNSDSRYCFMMGEPEEGLAKFFENTDKLSDVFSLFSDKDILKILFFMYSRQNFPVTLSVISEKTNIEIKKSNLL